MLNHLMDETLCKPEAPTPLPGRLAAALNAVPKLHGPGNTMLFSTFNAGLGFDIEPTKMTETSLHPVSRKVLRGDLKQILAEYH